MKQTKKKYIKPSIKAIKIKKENIITTSGGTDLLTALFGAGKGGARVN